MPDQTAAVRMLEMAISNFEQSSAKDESLQELVGKGKEWQKAITAHFQGSTDSPGRQSARDAAVGAHERQEAPTPQRRENAQPKDFRDASEQAKEMLSSPEGQPA